MRTFLIILLTVLNIVTLSAQSSTIRQGLKKTKQQFDNWLFKYGDNILLKKVSKDVISWEDYAKKSIKSNLSKTAKSQYSPFLSDRNLQQNLSLGDLKQRNELIKVFINNNTYPPNFAIRLENLPLSKEFTKVLQDNITNHELINKLLTDIENNSDLLEYLNNKPSIYAYSKLKNTSIRTDVNRLEWIENLQHTSDKVSNAKKLKSKYDIKNLQIKELEGGELIYQDGDKILAKEKDGRIYAWGGKKNDKGIVDKSCVNNLLNQNLFPNSIYVVDDRFKYFVDNKGRVYKAEGVLLKEARGRNADLQAIGRDRYGKNSGINSDLDDGGHLFSQELGGPVELINIVAQLKTENRGNIWKALENELSKALKLGKKATLKVELKYAGDEDRPILYKVWSTIDGVEKYEEILN